MKSWQARTDGGLIRFLTINSRHQMEMDIQKMEENRTIDSVSCPGCHEYRLQSGSRHCYWSRGRHNLVAKGIFIAWHEDASANRDKALKGSTVEDLHKSWSFSTSVLELLTAGRSFNLVALAALTAKMALVDNLLLQKAAGTMPSTYEQAGIKLRLPTWQQQLPSNYVGAFNADGTVGAFTTNFSYILHDYALNGAFIQADSFDMFEEFTSICTGTCFARVPGYDLQNQPPCSCSMSQWALQFKTLLQTPQHGF